MISTSSRSVLETLDEIVWAVNPQNDTLEQLAAYLGQYGRDFFQTTPIECQVPLPIQLLARPLTAEARHNLFLAVQESLCNVLKHARASRVSMAMSLRDSLFEIVVEDNGCGFDLERFSTVRQDTKAAPVTRGGNGLINMRRRLQSIGAEFALETERGRGTKVLFRVPLKGGDQ